MAFLYSLCADSLEHLPTDITNNYVGNFQLSSQHKNVWNLSLIFDAKVSKFLPSPFSINMTFIKDLKIKEHLAKK